MLGLQGVIKFIEGHREIILIFIPVLIFGLLIYFYGFDGRGIYEGKVAINRHVFRVSVADTPLERGQGLSGVSSLGDTEGMLFVFKRPSIHRF